MLFKSYCEIENSYSSKFMNAIHEQGFDNPEIQYAVFTKIDGSNLQCSINENDEFIVGSRSKWIERGDNFLGYERALRNENVEECLRIMKKKYEEKYSIPNEDKWAFTVFGELCGGFYRHPDIMPIKGAIKVQNRIDYCPDNMWVPFDIRITQYRDGETYSKYLDCDTVKELCDVANLPCQIERFRGTLEECLKYPNDFIDDTGHILWGLPIISNNITEGVVIKPIYPEYFRNGQRVIIKNKNDKFKERTIKAPKEKVEEIPMNDLELKYFNIMREYMSESRLYSVISKIGEVNQKKFGMIMGLFVKDLLEDFNSEYQDEIKKIEKETDVDNFNFKKALKAIQKEAADFIRPTFLKILNDQQDFYG